jgi:heat shock protein HslJ
MSLRSTLILISAGTLILFLLSTAASCNKDEEEVTLYSIWQFTNLESKGTDPGVYDSIPGDLTIKVMFSQLGQVTVESYCNSGSGTFSVKGAELTVSSLSMTEKYCYIDEPLDWEAMFVENFRKSQYYLIEDRNMVLLTEGDFNLNFKKIN